MKVLISIFLFLALLSLKVSAQGEANNWYFGNHAALNFSTGSPVSLTDSKMYAGAGCTSLSDSAGNLLFYSNGGTIWNRNHQEMLNGTGLNADESATQAALGLKAPGSDHLYYIFTVGGTHTTPLIFGAYYSVIDLSLDGGLGAVPPWQKNIPLPGADSAMEVITAVACANQEGFWVFVRSFSVNNKILAYLVDHSGVHQTPVVSPCLYNFSFNGQAGTSKASPDGRYYVYGPSGWHAGIPLTELYEMNAYTGTMTPVFLFNSNGINHGAEFSANSEFLYLSCDLYGTTIEQYDLSYLSDPVTFQNSRYQVYSHSSQIGNFYQMQLAPDGKIYISQPMGPDTSKFLSVISNPSQKGADCGFQFSAIPLVKGRCSNGLPTFIQSYFARFVFAGECLGSPTYFTSRFNPAPDSIAWDFDDPGSGAHNFSDSINPVHVFSDTGFFHVTTTAFYLNGHQETATRLVRISPLPAVNLGADKTACPKTDVLVEANAGFSSYLWSTGENSVSVIVPDTGLYWVRVLDTKGCANSDTIHVKSFPPPMIDETDLVLSPTTCGGSTGAITGLTVSGTAPLIVEWKNSSNQSVGDTIDLYHLPVDNYTLVLSDGNGCDWPTINYTINDIGDVLIYTVIVSESHCGQHDGAITVVATTGLASMLKYSIDNGQNYFLNLGRFTNLPQGNYRVKVMVTDTNQPCQKVYDHNPLTIDQMDGPVVTNVVAQYETGTQADGSITILATGSGDSLYYTVSGITQINNGYFGQLSAGTYTCSVTDPFGCDTVFTVTVNNLTMVRLQAIAGDGSACLGNVAVLPLLANNFSHVSAFESRLKYNMNQVTCQNYLNTNPALTDSLQVDLFPAMGEISLTWNGKIPVNLPDGSTLVELSFASLLTGQDSLKWDISPGICTFLDSLGNIIAPEFKQGQVRVYSIPQATITDPGPVCEGSDLLLLSHYQQGTGNGTISYQWTGPEGTSGNDPLFYLDELQTAQAGNWTLTVSDTNHCQSSASVEVNIIPLPVSGFPADKDTLWFDEMTRLEALPGYASYRWNTGDSTSSILVTSEGWYRVVMQTEEGCTSSDSLMMLYSFAPFTMPNAFTPDGDGKNDAFRPVTLPEKVQSFSMYIYDRWGRQVFATKDLGNGWNGIIDGKPAPMGVYTYVISYSNQAGEVRKRTGMVTLVR